MKKIQSFRCRKGKLILVTLGLCFWVAVSCTCVGDPAGRFQAFKLPNLHRCAPIWISGCYSRPNFSSYWEWLCVKKLLAISRLVWMHESVEGGIRVCSRQDGRTEQQASRVESVPKAGGYSWLLGGLSCFISNLWRHFSLLRFCLNQLLCQHLTI